MTYIIFWVKWLVSSARYIQAIHFWMRQVCLRTGVVLNKSDFNPESGHSRVMVTNKFIVYQDFKLNFDRIVVLAIINMYSTQKRQTVSYVLYHNTTIRSTMNVWPHDSMSDNISFQPTLICLLINWWKLDDQIFLQIVIYITNATLWVRKWVETLWLKLLYIACLPFHSSIILAATW